ncbi:hypothetical protein ANCCAN_05806 [Ancylostoma caninum]|uniref:ET module n=1 Tax=Ancylostoma caninum TaxID=29170 RepID=A0A368GUT8_ANCCA|nr:hypothetical protein ANCCAN_05806 [Ancylostoma caninum]
MLSLGQFLLLLLFPAYALAIRCYNGFTTINENPNKEVVCPWSSYCTKTAVKMSKGTMYTYRCDPNLCRKDGCVIGMNGVDNCCCSKDLCNTSAKTNTFLIFALIILLKLLL